MIKEEGKVDLEAVELGVVAEEENIFQPTNRIRRTSNRSVGSNGGGRRGSHRSSDSSNSLAQRMTSLLRLNNNSKSSDTSLEQNAMRSAMSIRNILPGNRTSGADSVASNRRDVMSLGDAAALVREADEKYSMNPKLYVNKRFKIGDYVVINNFEKGTEEEAILLNQYGYAKMAKGGKNRSDEMTKGPFEYILAIVENIHHSEIVPYYTVRREDNNQTLRSDVCDMEKISLDQANKARIHIKRHSACSTEYFDDTDFTDDDLGEPTYVWIGQIQSVLKHLTDGAENFQFNISLSPVNLFVICHIYFIFIDQIRLTFIPPELDETFAILSLIVWLTLVLELIFEVMIRPVDYYSRLRSVDAFSPETQRYIDDVNIAVEALALIAFLPEILCTMRDDEYNCGGRYKYGLLDALTKFYYDDGGDSSSYDFFAGTLIIGVVRLRIVGLTRHLINCFLREDIRMKTKVVTDKVEVSVDEQVDKERYQQNGQILRRSSKEDLMKVDESSTEKSDDENYPSHIATAMMIKNSNYLILIIFVVTIILPLLYVAIYSGDDFGRPKESARLLEQYAQTNLTNAGLRPDGICPRDGLIFSWLSSIGIYSVDRFNIPEASPSVFVVWGKVSSPKHVESGCNPECGDGNETCASRNITQDFCNLLYERQNQANANREAGEFYGELCKEVWDNPKNSNKEEAARTIGVRYGSIFNVYLPEKTEDVKIDVLFNIQGEIGFAASRLLMQQACLVFFMLFMVYQLRKDTCRVVILPVQEMLGIVSRYKKDPMRSEKEEALTPIRVSAVKRISMSEDNPTFHRSFETEQLVNAFQKITALLRKCWGIAGANIISTNLQDDGIKDMDEIINPLVPGKNIHALFAFAAIKSFDTFLAQYDEYIMVLINKIANVVHDCVENWSLEEKGQCNKNLGHLFLLVFYIEDDAKLRIKLENAINDFWDGKKNEVEKAVVAENNNDNPRDIDMTKLPGIDKFADFCLISLLKMYVGIHRDVEIDLFFEENKFLGGYGVLPQKGRADMIFGMDAGWAVEGAVGSKYKIDATYLSPHVNMASRMMSLCNQYGVSIFLSEAVQVLLSNVAKSNLRHVDTVTVKGSKKVQKIFTYDIRNTGDSFLSFASAGAAKHPDGPKYYWERDQDLYKMREHITDEFMDKYNFGRDEYLAGRWRKATDVLKEADAIMIRNIVETGYYNMNEELAEALRYELEKNTPDHLIEDEEVRAEKDKYHDGPCLNLIKFMEDRECDPSKCLQYDGEEWKGFRNLVKK